jgi:hypothetical protein
MQNNKSPAYAGMGIFVGAFISMVLDAYLDSSLPPIVGWVFALSLAGFGWFIGKDSQK